jgi:D-glycero-D-manno-heptose 1,7-bisphosphate phosphatase
MSAELRPALLLDRDGVLNEEVRYLHRPEDVVLIPGAAEAVAQVNRLGFPVVVVTNQAGIGRGLYAEADYRAVEARLAELLAARGAHLDASYFCPHHPEHGLGAFRVACECRKPRPGMLLRAARELGLDLSRSVLVGDKRSDLEAGRAAGCRTILVRTGYGVETEAALSSDQGTMLADGVFDSLGRILPFLLDELDPSKTTSEPVVVESGPR